MAATAINKSEIIEYHDSSEQLNKSVEYLSNLIKVSEHCVIYTGAGISTSAGINDFRGPDGKWTRLANGQKPIVSTHFQLPTQCHMAIKKLINENIVKHVISQNTDGLHVKSGIPLDRISEVHGNSYKEYCKKCSSIYFRDYRTREANRKVHDHQTSRKCTKCNQVLYDSIINFGENLPVDQLESAEEESSKCDLAIVLGTSMRVRPACEFPMMRKRHGKLVICNLQQTPYDSKADLVIHTRTDSLMELLMDSLCIEIPTYVFDFNFQVSMNASKGSIEITNCSANLQRLLKYCIVTDSENNSLDLDPRNNFKSKLKCFGDKKGVVLKFVFNFMRPVEINTFIKHTTIFSFQLNKQSLEQNLEDALTMKLSHF